MKVMKAMTNKINTKDMELIKIYVESTKIKEKFKLSPTTTVMQLEEYLKRRNKFGPTESIFLFVKEQRKLMTPGKTIDEYAKEIPLESNGSSSNKT